MAGPDVRDIPWRERLGPALEEARRTGRPLLLMGLLNGLGCDDGW